MKKGKQERETGKQKIRQPERNECGECKAEPIQEQERRSGGIPFLNQFIWHVRLRQFISRVTQACLTSAYIPGMPLFRCCHTIVNYSQP
jgi:hypothetical protein